LHVSLTHGLVNTFATRKCALRSDRMIRAIPTLDFMRGELIIN
jgi:hypothetical protein